jgi:uncharacterized glyoxalase superfamily protein PhnB
MAKAQQAAKAPEADPAQMPMPKVLGGIVPYLNVEGAVKAAEFYAKAFGAKEVGRHPVDDSGRTMHIHLHLNGASLMLGDPYPEHGYAHKPAQAFDLLLNVDDIDAAWERAVKAGAEIVMPLQLMFWGDRYGQLRDPFGISWAFNGPAKG